MLDGLRQSLEEGVVASRAKACVAFRTQLFVESHATAVGATGYADEDRDPVVGFET